MSFPTGMIPDGEGDENEILLVKCFETGTENIFQELG